MSNRNLNKTINLEKNNYLNDTELRLYLQTRELLEKLEQLVEEIYQKYGQYNKNPISSSVTNSTKISLKELPQSLSEFQYHYDTFMYLFAEFEKIAPDNAKFARGRIDKLIKDKKLDRQNPCENAPDDLKKSVQALLRKWYDYNQEMKKKTPKKKKTEFQDVGTINKVLDQTQDILISISLPTLKQAMADTNNDPLKLFNILKSSCSITPSKKQKNVDKGRPALDIDELIKRANTPGKEAYVTRSNARARLRKLNIDYMTGDKLI